MNIVKITNQDIFSDNTLKSIENKSKDLLQENENKKDKLTTSNIFSKNILLNTLEKLENSIQMDNNHPLDSINAAPLETLDEAVLELNYLKQSFSTDIFINAQANLQAESVIALFITE